MVKRLRLSPLTAATRVRIPAESPKCASARCAFFHAGFQTRVRVLLCNPHPVHARVPRHFRVSSSPIGARCKANPGRVTITAHNNAPFLFAGILPGSPCFSQGATRCTLACFDTSVSRHPLSALAVRRIPAESPLRRITMRRFCLPGFSPGHLAFRKVLPGARRCVPRSLCGAARLTSRAVLLRPFAPHVARIPKR